MKLQVKNLDNKEVGSIELSEAISGEIDLAKLTYFIAHQLKAF